MQANFLDNKPYVEYIDGEAIRKVSPKRRHAIVQLALARLLQDASVGRGTVGTEWRFHLTRGRNERTTLVPDVAFVSSKRLAALPEPDREEPPFAPDIAAEVRSPSDRIAVVERKIELYLAFGALVVLDVLPNQRIVRAITADGIAVRREGEFIADARLPWLRIGVAGIFAELDR